MTRPIQELNSGEVLHFIDCSFESSLTTLLDFMRDYTQTWKIGCALANVEGVLIAGDHLCGHNCQKSAECTAARRMAIRESVRWGEPAVMLCPHNHAIWAMPIIENTHVIGGFVAACATPEIEVSNLSTRQVRQAMADLLNRMIAANLTNPALLELRRIEAARESERAEAIHAVKDQNYRSIREIYITEEPSLIAAIKAGDRANAREIINRVLVGIYFQGRERPALLKSFLLELVVMISRSAVEAGGDPTELLGTNYSAFAELANIDSEEALCAWLVNILERSMDAISTNHRFPISVLLGAAMKYAQQNLGENITRDEVAKIACLSPSHFSRVIKQTFGQSFTTLITRMRVEKARELLVRTDKNLLQICMECGFNEQSYFTRVFQKATGQPPGIYRKSHRSRL